LAAGLRQDPLGELTALPQTPSCIKGGGGAGDGNESEVERTGKKQEAKRKERSREREGYLE